MGGRCAVPGDGTQKPGPGAHSPEKVNTFIAFCLKQLRGSLV